jgi:hypothetical protein
MTTFADIKKETEGIFTSYVGFDIPAGHFGVIVPLDGNTVTYLLEGEQDDPEATVKGRIVIPTKKRLKESVVCSG